MNHSDVIENSISPFDLKESLYLDNPQKKEFIKFLKRNKKKLKGLSKEDMKFFNYLLFKLCEENLIKEEQVETGKFEVNFSIIDYANYCKLQVGAIKKTEIFLEELGNAIDNVFKFVFERKKIKINGVKYHVMMSLVSGIQSYPHNPLFLSFSINSCFIGLALFKKTGF